MYKLFRTLLLPVAALFAFTAEETSRLMEKLFMQVRNNS